MLLSLKKGDRQRNSMIFLKNILHFLVIRAKLMTNYEDILMHSAFRRVDNSAKLSDNLDHKKSDTNVQQRRYRHFFTNATMI